MLNRILTKILLQKLAGADFGHDVLDPNGAPLSEQVTDYINGLTPTAPSAAPDHATVPGRPDFGSRTNQIEPRNTPLAAATGDHPMTSKLPLRREWVMRSKKTRLLGKHLEDYFGRRCFSLRLR
jgi:hypothetical protein